MPNIWKRLSSTQTPSPNVPLIKPKLSTFYQNRAASYEMLKKYKQVIDDCNKAIELNNRYVKALVRRAKGLYFLVLNIF
jgi:tetratricopeptide (TPR) repeat protein